MKVWYKTLIGSRLRGLALPESDYDYKGFGMFDLNTIIGLNRQETNRDINESEKKDSQIYSLQKYLKDVYKSSPNIFEIAFADPQHYEICTDEGQEVIDFVRNNLVTKDLHYTYTRYLQSQKKDMISDRIQSKRLELVQKYGFDTKSAYSTLSAGYQIYDFLTTGTMNPTLSGFRQELCMNIRLGKFTKDYVLSIIETLESAIDLALVDSKLPNKPNFELVNNFCVRMYYKYLKSELGGE